MFQFTTRVTTRGYETDVTGTIPLATYLSYLEHLRWETLTAPELGLEELVHAGHFFVVHDQTAVLHRRVGMGIELELRGVIEKVGRSRMVIRHEIVRTSDGGLVVAARVQAVWLAPDRKLARIPEAVREAVVGPGPTTTQPGPAAGDFDGRPGSLLDPPVVVLAPLPLEPEPELTEPGEAYVHRVPVRPRDIDIFDHVNAVTWLRLADDARTIAVREGILWPDAAFRTRRVRLRYQREARLGSELAIQVWEVPGGIGVQAESDGLVCVRARLEA